jgi:hypothetical protein
MPIGPLEYLVIGMTDQGFMEAFFTELNAIHESGQIRVVDLILVGKDATGVTTMTEVNDLNNVDSAVADDPDENLIGLLTAEDVAQLTDEIPPSTSALVVLFEHTWAIKLAEVLRKGGGMVYSGGMVAHEALFSVNAELAAKEAQNA